jgi:hypothetical protein
MQNDRINTEAGSRMPSSMVKTKSKLDMMNPDEIRAFFKNREDFAAQHRGGKIEPGFSAKELAQRQEFSYGREFAKGRPYSRHFENTELDEGLKDWLQRMAVAGILVGSVAGVGSINNAINNSVPAIQAMNKALDTAQEKGDTQLIAQIQKDLQDAKLRLDIGKDLNQVRYLQDKYKNFMPADYKSNSADVKFKELEHTNESEIVMSKDGFIQSLASKIMQPQKGLGKAEFDDRLLAKMYKLLTGHDVEIDGNKFTVRIDNKKQTEDADMDAQFKSDVLRFLNMKMAGIERQLQITPANTPEEKENKEFAMKLFDFVQKKLEQRDDGNNTLQVPRSMMKKESAQDTSKVLEEGLRKNDLEGMIYPLIEIDTFRSKMGEDHDVCVITFQSKDRHPAKDFMEFIEKGYPFVLDADVSAGENKDGEYSIFVEIERSPKIAENIMEMIFGVSKLTNIHDWEFKYYKSSDKQNVNTENLKKTVPVSKRMYEQTMNRFRTDEVRSFFSRTLMDDLSFENNIITIYKPFNNKYQFELIGEGDGKLIEGLADAPNIDAGATAEVFWLTKVIGDYNINKIGEDYAFTNGNRTMILKRR